VSETFKRVIENFECENCGAHVTGNGYTDHCPKCLYSKHVDITPGDRAAECGGPMQPTNITPSKKGGYIISYQCTWCKHTYNNKTANDDDITSFIENLHPELP